LNLEGKKIAVIVSWLKWLKEKEYKIRRINQWEIKIYKRNIVSNNSLGINNGGRNQNNKKIDTDIDYYPGIINKILLSLLSLNDTIFM
jgi:hypothetical protein